jgi:hypothetical protein
MSYTSNSFSTLSVEISQKDILRMKFLYNAVENGWTVKKRQDSYIFSKKHENKKEVFQQDYLEKFINSNFQLPG